MRTLILILLFAYPRDFRARYRAQILHEFDECDAPGYATRIAADVVAAGLTMRLESLWRDLHFAGRMLAKAPVFTTIVMSTLALAIAGNAVIFSMLDAVLLKPLPFANSDRLGYIDQVPPAGTPQIFVFTPREQERERIAREATTFASVAGATSDVETQARIGTTTRTMHRALVTPNYFDTLAVHPELGTLFAAGQPKDANGAIISDAVWRRDFGASPDALGKTLVLDGVTFTVRGVLPPAMLDVGFAELTHDDVWTPMPNYTAAKNQPAVVVVVRLKDGATWASARADLQRIGGAKKSFNFGDNRLTPLADTMFADARRFLWTVFAGVFAVLLVACANIANLLLARGAARSGEFSVRSALGASSRRIGVQLLTEMTLLFTAGAGAGLILANFALPVAVALMPFAYPRLDQAHMDGRVVGFICAMTCVVTLLAGVIPTLWRTRTSAGALQRSGRNPMEGAARARFALVALEVAVAFALTVSSGLMVRSYVSLIRTDIGFDARSLYDVSFNGKHAPDGTYAARLLKNIAAIPGVSAVTPASVVPFSHIMTFIAVVHMAGGPVPATNSFDYRFQTRTAEVSPNFFTVFGIPFHRGRGLNERDRATSVVVNEAFVKHFIPHGNPLGQRVLGMKSQSQIVGVVADVRDSLGSKAQPMLYRPFSAQTPALQIVVRTNAVVPKLATRIAAVVAAVDPAAPVPTVTSLDEAIAADAKATRSGMLLLTALAVLALVLALGGIYGIVSYAAARRYHEMGIRMALGAAPGDVRNRIIGGALIQSGVGVGAGIVLAALSTQLLQDDLASISPLDTPTFAAVIALFIFCSAVSALVPAVRAARSHPSLTLRYE